jgi:hypothetical protein
MTSDVRATSDWSRSGWRYAMWAIAAALAGFALYAWEAVTVGEYGLVVVAIMFALVAVVVERAAATRARWAYGVGIAIAVLTALGQMWMNLAVGIIGSEDNPTNLIFFLIPLAVLTGLPLLRRPGRLAWLLAAAAVGQVIGAVYGTLAPLGPPEPEMAPLGGIIILTAYFAGLWLNAAALFRAASDRR